MASMCSGQVRWPIPRVRLCQGGRHTPTHGPGSDDCDLHIIPSVGRRPGMLRRASCRGENHGDEGDVGGHDQPAGPTIQTSADVGEHERHDREPQVPPGHQQSGD